MLLYQNIATLGIRVTALIMLWSDIEVSIVSMLSMIKGLENTRSRMFAPLVGIWTSWSRYRKLVSSISEFAWVEQVPVECQSINGKLKSPSIRGSRFKCKLFS